MKKIFWVVLFGINNFIYPQGFSVEQYQTFLNNFTSGNGAELQGSYPTGRAFSDIGIKPPVINFLDSIRIKYALSRQEEDLLMKNGFVVSERLNFETFTNSFLDIYHKDLPVYITSDAVLHAFHRGYTDILENTEKSLLFGRMRQFLIKMHRKMGMLDSVYSSKVEMRIPLRDADLFLVTALRLSGDNSTAYYAENTDKMNTLLSYISVEQPRLVQFFTYENVIYDFSQFALRGHYTNDGLNGNLAKYFRTMIWLGRTEFYLKPPVNSEPPVSPATVQRQVITTFILNELIDAAQCYEDIEYLEEFLRFIAGEQDNATVSDIKKIKNMLGIQSAADFISAETMNRFTESINKDSSLEQNILSQILVKNPLNPGVIMPAVSFYLFGQRFSPDSYIFSNVVYDRIEGQNCRIYPSTLDVLFGLGNNAAGELLKPEIEQYGYGKNLAALRYLLDSYEESFWHSSIYNSRLSMIRGLGRFEAPESAQRYMKTGAFKQRLMNSQLGAWAELRYDNLLYNKQSYSGGPTCSFPLAYLEPIPEIYRALKKTAEIGKELFSQDYKTGWYFRNLELYADTLLVISEKELAGEPLSENEIRFLRTLLYEEIDGCYGEVLDGWYSLLFNQSDRKSRKIKMLQNDFIVADVHTAPVNCSGGPEGGVLHSGTGQVSLGFYLIEQNGEWMVYTGPHYGYYEYRTLNFKRLNKDEWKAGYLWQAARPSWVNVYMTDSTGARRSGGPVLSTSPYAENSKTDSVYVPVEYLTARNYPNPFNPSTIISFTLPEDLAHQQIELGIYDILGNLIRILYKNSLPSGIYLAEWDGRDGRGGLCPSGAYIYRLSSGSKTVSGKMVLVR